MVGCIGLAGCCGPTAFSQPLPSPLGPDQRILQLGRIDVHVGVVRELPPRRRLALDALLDPQKIFESIKASRRASEQHLEARRLNASFNATSLIPASKTIETTDAVDGTAARSTSESFAAAPVNEAPIPGFSSDAPSSAGLSAPYHQILYATADTILGGRALESVYNVDAIPTGYAMFSVPIVVSFQPGQITREGYVAEAELNLESRTCSLSNIAILAVAPSGFAAFNDSANMLAESLGLGLGVGVPLVDASASAAVDALVENVTRFAEVARHPEFQVAIPSKSGIRIRYLGTLLPTKDLRSPRTTLQPTTFNAEILLLGRPAREEEFATAGCVRDASSSVAPDAEARPEEFQIETFDIETHAERKTHNPSPRPSPLRAEVEPSGGIRSDVGFNGQWTFAPTEEQRFWTATEYGDDFERSTSLYVVPQKIIAIREVATAELALVVEGSGQSCHCVETVTPDGAGKLETPTARCAAMRGEFTIPTTRGKLPKGSVARIRGLKGPASCVGVLSGWSSFVIDTIEGRATSPATTTLRIETAEAMMESDAIAIRVSLATPEIEGDPKVLVNGLEATKRAFNFESRKDGSFAGELYVTVNQKVDRRDAHGRTLRVEVMGTTKVPPGAPAGTRGVTLRDSKLLDVRW